MCFVFKVMMDPLALALLWLSSDRLMWYFCWIKYCFEYYFKRNAIFFFFPLLNWNQDVPLISLANIFQNARLWEDALTVARMAVEIAPHFVVNHFTLANVYITMVMTAVTFSATASLTYCHLRSASASTESQDVSLCWRGFCVSWRQEEFEKAMHWYESTLKLQPEFAPAKDRLRTIQCYLLTKRERRQPWTTDPKSVRQSCTHQIKNRPTDTCTLTQTHTHLTTRDLW